MEGRTSTTVLNSVEPGVEKPARSLLQRLTGILFEPRSTFEDVDRRPSWIPIYALLALSVMASTYVLTIRLDYETYTRKALELNPFSRNLSEEQIESIISRPQGPIQKLAPIFVAPIGVLMGYLAIAGVFLLFFILMGSSISYRKSLAVTIWAMAPPAIIVALLSAFLMFMKDPELLELNPAANVVSNLGLLISAKEHPALSSLLTSVDVFSFWTIFLLSIGFATISKLPTRTAATAVSILWVIWVAGKAGFFALAR